MNYITKADLEDMEFLLRVRIDSLKGSVSPFDRNERHCAEATRDRVIAELKTMEVQD